MTETAWYTLAQRPDLQASLSSLHAAAWPQFMLHSPVADQYWGALFTDFPAYQVVVVDANDQPIAAGHTIPLTWDGTHTGLPAGWDAALTHGVVERQAHHAATTLCALAAVIAPPTQGGGLSAQVIQAMKTVAQQQQLDGLIAPVRPSHKHRYPLMPMEDYVSWRRDDGLPMDPWLRVHARLGAEVLQVAPESMRIVGSIAEWEQWGGLPLHTSGRYIVPGALVPVEIDREQNQGVYREPNVWMRHRVTER